VDKIYVFTRFSKSAPLLLLNPTQSPGSSEPFLAYKSNYNSYKVQMFQISVIIFLGFRDNSENEEVFETMPLTILILQAVAPQLIKPHSFPLFLQGIIQR
jgi:hypothetical protein